MTHYLLLRHRLGPTSMFWDITSSDGDEVGYRIGLREKSGDEVRV